MTTEKFEEAKALLEEIADCKLAIQKVSLVREKLVSCKSGKEETDVLLGEAYPVLKALNFNGAGVLKDSIR